MEGYISLAALLCVVFTSQVQCESQPPPNYYERRAEIIRNTKCLEKANVTVDEVIDFPEEQLEYNTGLQRYVVCEAEYYNIIDTNNCTFVQFFIEDERRDEVFTKIEPCKESLTANKGFDCGYKLYQCMSEVMSPKN